DSRGGGGPAPSQRVIMKAEPITIPLQEDFHVGDTDGDGQIAYFEWRNWKPTELAEFLRLDANRDGFVTPREIKFAPEASGSAAVPPTTAASTTPAVSAPAASTPPQATTTPTTTVPAVAINPDAIDRSSVQAKRAIYFFTQLDKNKNGTVEPDEWAISKTLKPQFEKGGVDLSKPLSEDEFIAHFVRVSSG
ncbi:MAG: hypothetical protein KDA58_08475, partial [Planctomycetaceae bacterium]|nr:hypothetical protein [Planctomycetaceae bacterium]